MFKWNSKKSTYYGLGKKGYKFGDPIPDNVIGKMGKTTVDEYVDKGLILDDKAAVAAEKSEAENIRLDKLKEALDLGIKMHPKTGVEKIQIAIDDFNALVALKKEAMELGIDPSDDVKFDELKALVDEKKAGDE